MCPYYDKLNGICKLSGAKQIGIISADNDRCKSSENWKKCPNYTCGQYDHRK